MKRLVLVSVACMAWVSGSVLEAAIPLGRLEDFTTPPASADWSTKSVSGIGGSIDTIGALDAAVQTNSAASITNALVLAAPAAPGSHPLALWSSGGRSLVTRPAGNAYTILMATVINGMPIDMPSLWIAYDFGVPSPVAGEDPGLAGHRVYYSLSGEAHTWIPAGIPAAIVPEPRAMLTTLSLGSWPPGSLLYVIWVDDNGGGSDGSFSLDNFLVGTCLVPLGIIQEPVSTNVCQGRTIRLTVRAGRGCDGTAVGLVHQWIKVGVGPINPADNPTAVEPTLVIPNASLSDTGDYFVVVADAGSSDTSVTSHVEVVPDEDPTGPRLVSAVNVSETNVVLNFSRTLDKTSAEDPSRYVLTPGVAVTRAELSPNGASVTLSTERRAFPGLYTLRMAQLTDGHPCHNPIEPNPTETALTGVRVLCAWSASEWRYATNTQDATLLPPRTPWFAPNFVPGPEWLTGQGFFGFEPTAAITNALPPPRVVTPLIPNDIGVLGTANSNLFVTAYFRREITLPILSANTMFALCHYTDDGAVFYLDGLEIERFNMPRVTPLTFTTRADTLPSEDATWQAFLFAAVPGPQTLAIEVHQAGISSTDVLFGVEIREITLPPALSIQRAAAGGSVLSWSADSAWALAGSAHSTGPFIPVAGDPGGVLQIPPAMGTNNHFFYLLRYVGLP